MERRARHVPDDEPALVARMIDLASEYGRYGYRRVTILLQNEQADARVSPTQAFAPAPW